MNGTLTAVGTLSGALSGSGAISGSLTGSATLAGVLAGAGALNGALTATGSLAGAMTIPAVIGGTTYSGPYEVTSFTAEPLLTTSLVLDTSQKYMTDDVTVYSVPTTEEYNTAGGVTFTIG